MGQIFYWKGNSGDNQNINTVRTSATRNHEKFISKSNLWNRAKNWAVEIGRSGDNWNGEGDPRWFATSSRYPVAGDDVRFEKVICSLDGGESASAFPYTECLVGGTTLDYCWGGGTHENGGAGGTVGTAGPLASVHISETYSTHLLALRNAFYPHGNFGCRIGVNFNTTSDSHTTTDDRGAAVNSDGLGIYANKWTDHSWKSWNHEPGDQGDGQLAQPQIQPTSWWKSRQMKTHTFTAGFRANDLDIYGGAHYLFQYLSHYETKYGNTFGNINLARGMNGGEVDYFTNIRSGREGVAFQMAGKHTEFEITNSVRDTSIYPDLTLLNPTTYSPPCENTFVSNTLVPTTIIGSINRGLQNDSTDQQHYDSIVVDYDATTIRVHPDRRVHNQSDNEQAGNYPYSYQRGYTTFGTVILSGGTAGAARNGFKVTNLYMEDTNQYHGGITNDKNGSNVVVRLGGQATGATIVNLYQYSGWLRPSIADAVTSNPEIHSDRFIIQNGEINSNCVLQGFDHMAPEWNNFEIQGHTLGTNGNKNGLIQVDNHCDIRLAAGARVSTTTRTADVSGVKLSSAAYLRKAP